ncbi:hypothetical protein F4779DRAFT_631695 [Xylariaceae sp. FL0662B]|nr:hypothetical protein F4779DRAFT_631695 [Xylariaceae sp. FL0662B]
MSVYSPLSLLSALVFSAVDGSGFVIIATRSDASIIAAYGRQGLCLSYFANPNMEKSLAPLGYKDPDIPRDQIDPSIVYKDDDGNKFTPGTCVCDLGIANALAAVVIQALSKLDEVICAAILTAFTSIIEVGIEAVPEAIEATAAGKAVEGISTTCRISDFDFDLELPSVFDLLTEAPDEFSTSKCCFKGKGDCAKPKA